MLDLLNTSTYRKINHNPLNKIINLVKKLILSPSIDEAIKLFLLPKNTLTPRIYGLPKIHKKDIPFRPIIRMIISLTYELFSLLSSTLQPFIGKTSSFIKYYVDFFHFIQTLHLDPTGILVSFLFRLSFYENSY